MLVYMVEACNVKLSEVKSQIESLVFILLFQVPYSEYKYVILIFRIHP